MIVWVFHDRAVALAPWVSLDADWCAANVAVCVSGACDAARTLFISGLTFDVDVLPVTMT